MGSQINYGQNVDLQAEQLQLQRQQALADMLRQRAVTPITSQTVSGRVVPVSPWESISKLGQAYFANQMNDKNDAKQAELGTAMRERQAAALRGLFPGQTDAPLSATPQASVWPGDPTAPPTRGMASNTDVTRAISAYQQDPELGRKLIENLATKTNEQKNADAQGISFPQLGRYQLGKAHADAVMQFQPGTTARDMSTGEERFTPKIAEGIALNNGVASEVPGYGAANAGIAGAAESAKAAANANYALTTLPLAGGPRIMTNAQVRDLAGAGQPPAAGPLPSGGAPSAAALPPGITPQLLNGLRRTESGGDPYAVNEQSGAMGPYQFKPATVAMLAKQGLKFDPFNEDQARGAAATYLGQLAQKNGGDVNKALAQYGGFITKDPSKYVAKVTGAPTAAAPAPTAMPGAQPTAMPGARPTAMPGVALQDPYTQKVQDANLDLNKGSMAGLVKEADSQRGVISTLQSAKKLIEDGTLGNSIKDRIEMAAHGAGVYQTPQTINTANLEKIANQLVLARGSLGAGVSVSDADRYDKAAGNFTKAQSNAERLQYIKVMEDIAAHAFDASNSAMKRFSTSGQMPAYSMPTAPARRYNPATGKIE